MRPAHYRKAATRNLTPRQREVMELIAAGLTNGEIGEALGISLDGAKAHVRDIMTKLEASSRQEAVVRWKEERSTPRRAGRWLKALVAIPALKVGALAVGAFVVAAGVAVVVVSTGGSDAAGPDTVSEYTSVLDALDAIDGPAILMSRSDLYFGQESVEAGAPEAFTAWGATLFDEDGTNSQLLVSIIPDGEQAGTQVLFDGVTLHRIEDGTYQSEAVDDERAINDGYEGVSVEKTRALMTEAASALQAAEEAGVVTRSPSVRPGLDELGVAVSANDAAALIQGEPIPGLLLLESDLTFPVALLSCATYLTGTGDGSFYYAFVVNSGGYGLTGGRCWVEEGGGQRDVHSVYQTWTVYPADGWEVLIAELAPGLAAIVFE